MKPVQQDLIKRVPLKNSIYYYEYLRLYTFMGDVTIDNINFLLLYYDDMYQYMYSQYLMEFLSGTRFIKPLCAGR